MTNDKRLKQQLIASSWRAELRDAGAKGSRSSPSNLNRTPALSPIKQGTLLTNSYRVGAIERNDSENMQHDKDYGGQANAPTFAGLRRGKRIIGMTKLSIEEQDHE